MTSSVVPAVLDGWMRPFQGQFTVAVWRHALVLVCGALLAPGRRTVAAALRVMGLGEVAGFAVYHRVLSHGHWCSRALAHRLLQLLVAAFVPDGPVVIGVDDSIERRWGARIAARGIYRDPVRSSRGHFVKASGLRWLSLMLLAPVPWARCVWGLPFLTVLAPSERYAAEQCSATIRMGSERQSGWICGFAWLDDCRARLSLARGLIDAVDCRWRDNQDGWASGSGSGACRKALPFRPRAARRR